MVDRHTLAMDPLGAISRSQDNSHDTSPSPKSSTSLDCSLPDAVSHILRDIQSRISKPDTPEWKEYSLEEGDWVVLKQQLTEQYPEKLRYRYFAESRTFVHERMISVTHDVISRHLWFIIQEEGKSLCGSRGEEGRAWWKDIANMGSSNKKSRKGHSEHQADECIGHISGDNVIIIEIAYSQKRAALDKLASFYLEECKKHVNLMISIDFDYRKSKKATLITWRKNGRATNRYEQVLRNNDGVLVPGEPLKISILDLAPRKHISPSLRDIVIEISVEELNQILRKVDKIEEREKEIEESDKEVAARALADGGPAKRTRSKTAKFLQT